MNGNRLDAVVASCDPRDSHAWLSVGRTKLAARPWEGIRRGRRVAIRIRPEDVLLCEGHPGRISARNVLPAHVRRVRRVPEGVRVEVDAGFPLTALITRAAERELRLRRGTALYAIVKAVAIAPEAGVTARYRVSLIGRNGMLDYGRLDFLRAVGRTGSLAAAAREIGITYRTAWLWAREANHAWGKPLVARTRGGRGGGGTALTPEGRAVVEYAAGREDGKGERGRVGG